MDAELVSYTLFKPATYLDRALLAFSCCASFRLMIAAYFYSRFAIDNWWAWRAFSLSSTFFFRRPCSVVREPSSFLCLSNSYSSAWTLLKIFDCVRSNNLILDLSVFIRPPSVVKVVPSVPSSLSSSCSLSCKASIMLPEHASRH